MFALLSLELSREIKLDQTLSRDTEGFNACLKLARTPSQDTQRTTHLKIQKYGLGRRSLLNVSGRTAGAVVREGGGGGI